MIKCANGNKTRAGIFWPQAQGSGGWGKEKKVDERSKRNPRQTWTLNATSRIPDSRNYCRFQPFQRNLDSGFQSLVGFRILWNVFRIPKPKIPDSTSKNFPDSGIRFPLHGAISSMTSFRWQREPCWCAFRQQKQHVPLTTHHIQERRFARGADKPGQDAVLLRNRTKQKSYNPFCTAGAGCKSQVAFW